MAVVVDDLLLLDCLQGRPPQGVAAELSAGDVLTTTGWYYRLGRAAFTGTGRGALSGRLQRLDTSIQEQVRSALDALPGHIALLAPEDVVPVMFRLRLRRPANFLAAEALATALLLEARIAVITDDPLIRAGADDLGLDYEVLT